MLEVEVKTDECPGCGIRVPWFREQPPLFVYPHDREEHVRQLERWDDLLQGKNTDYFDHLGYRKAASGG